MRPLSTFTQFYQMVTMETMTVTKISTSVLAMCSKFPNFLSDHLKKPGVTFHFSLQENLKEIVLISVFLFLFFYFISSVQFTDMEHI